MNSVSKNILETALRFTNAASRDETRFHLNGVHLKANGIGSFVLEACDGHIAARETLIGDSSILPVDLDIILSNEDLPKLKALLKNWKMRDLFEVTLEERVLVIKAGTDLVSIGLIVREFPKLDSVIPKRTGDVTISFNPELLLNIYKALNTQGKHQPQVTISFNPESSMSPIMVIVNENGNRSESQVAVIMPIVSSKAKEAASQFTEKYRAPKSSKKGA